MSMRKEGIVEKSIVKQTALHDALLIVVGSFIYALGVDCFQIPFGIAAGGVTGLATVIHAALMTTGIDVPIGIMTIAFNILLVVPVIRSGELRYTIRIFAGILASGFFLDILTPYVPELAGYDLFLAVLWGGAISGVGLGLVFRSGGNTGGMDIIAQFLSDRTGQPIGTWSMVCNAIVILISVPVFSLRNALYAVVCMIVTGRMIDWAIDGPKNQRACFVISGQHKKIANSILYEMGRGCTEVQARGVWSGQERPMLFIVLNRNEIGILKSIVGNIDPDAVVVISEVHEAFGEGFQPIYNTKD